MRDESMERDARREELFIGDLLFGLTHEEELEFEALNVDAPGDNLQSLAEIISLLDQHRSVAEDARLPASLRQRIRADAFRELPRPAEISPQRGWLRSDSRVPWGVAAASLVVTIAVLMMYGPARGPLGPTEDPSRLREHLLVSASDVVRADWADGPTPIPGATGDIAWSTGEQQGYMRFQGMQVNDPRAEQYQLWIFDRNQDEKTPIDGGVFDIRSSGEVVVPIRPALRVREPFLFAVTVEKPGGVVVSDRSRLPLLASVAR